MQARNLPALDVGGTSDPYLVARFEGTEHKTSVVYRSLAPVWRETLVFDTALRDMGTVLEVECFDYDLSSQDDSMGLHRVSLDNLRVGDYKNVWCTLAPDASGSSPLEPAPQVHLEYTLVPKRKPGSAAAHVHLSLLRADKLKVPGHGASPNPYVRLAFEDRVCRSRVVMGSREPDFSVAGDNEFEFLCDYPPVGRIEVEMFSYGMVTSDVCVGVAAVGR